MTTQDTAEEAMTDPTTGPTPLDLTTNSADIVAIAWPTGRPIYPYTWEEIAEGVDLYTQAMKAHTTTTRGGYREQ
ncbi:hypothetical protein Drose_16970 [Dactylosporangium roseum]|uniref:Uncharacterized protein n=1 Tax=Dactylosporangium roseum TaxID=47989 RepID=A0ABY5ZCG3_9ACTN|nr:hypothetical protein [Dactylosporangium roseum]UWZ39759.1 hypothetical protein Drose_16970 [Dactylosporangium roseum]